MMQKGKWTVSLLGMALYSQGATALPVSGLRIGAQAGYGTMDAQVRISLPNPPPAASDSSDVSGRNLIGGGTLEYGGIINDGSFFIGGVAGINFATIKGSKSTQGTFLLTSAQNDLTTTVRLRWVYDVALKAGYVFKDAAMPYIKAGGNIASWNAKSFSNGYSLSGSSSASLAGFTVGAGAEFPFSDRMTWGAEYTYHSTSSFKHNLLTPAGNTLLNISVSPKAHTFMVRLVYQIADAPLSSPPRTSRQKKDKGIKTPKGK